jgi:3-ketosteroid 9alpha-monooxygenase subunit B
VTSARAAHHALRIARIVQETADARSFVLDVPAALRPHFAYRAGQFLTFEVPWRETTLGRCYSLSSSPDCDAELAFTVKRVAEGRVSNWMHDALREGDEVRVLPPAGRFVLAAESERPLVLLGGGSGITPLFSILKTALATTARRARLVYANRDADSIIFGAALGALAAQHAGRLAIEHHLDAERGYLDAAGVRAALAGATDADFYLCGPTPFMSLVEAALREAGVPRDRIHIERFVSPPDGQLPVEMDQTAPEADALPSTITVQLDGATHEVPYTPGQSILQAARAAGLSPPFACEESYCGSCIATLVRGTVEMAVCHALDESERAEGLILPCQAKPTSEECEVRWD